MDSSKGVLKAEQLIPLMDFVLKNELKKMKIEEFLESIRDIQEKLSYVEKLEKIKIVDEINQLKITQTNQNANHQGTLHEINTYIHSFLERQKLIQQGEQQFKGQMNNDVEYVKREQIGIILEQERIKDDYLMVKRELESSRTERETIRRNQDIMQEANNVDQVLLKLDIDKVKEDQKNINAELLENKNIYKRIMQVHEDILSERRKLDDDMQKVKAQQENGMKLLQEKLEEDRQSIMKEREALREEQNALKQEQERTRQVIQQVIDDQEKLRKECERLDKEKKKIRIASRLRKEQLRIKEEKKKIQMELEKIETDKKSMKHDRAKMKHEREQFLSIVTQQHQHMRGPMSCSSENCSSSSSDSLLAIDYPVEANSLENVTFHYDDSDIKYEEFDDDCMMDDGSYLTLPLVNDGASCSANDSSNSPVYNLDDYDDYDNSNETTEDETDEEDDDDSERKEKKNGIDNATTKSTSVLPYNNKEDLD